MNFENRIFALRTKNLKDPTFFRLLPEGRLEGTSKLSRWEMSHGGISFYWADKPDVLAFVMLTDMLYGLAAYPVTVFDEGAGSHVIAVDCTESFSLPSKDRFEVVVAKYKENTSWLSLIPNNATVYCKGDASPGEIALPNFGREAGTYLHHIVTRWDSLADRTLFFQASPWEHRVLPLDQYVNEPGPFVCMENFVRPMHLDTYLSVACKVAWWKQYVRVPVPRYFVFPQGAQFAVDRELIHRRGLEYWQMLYEMSVMPWLHMADTKMDNYCTAVMLEQAWPYIMNFRNDPVLPAETTPPINPPVERTQRHAAKLWRSEATSARYGHGVEF